MKAAQHNANSRFDLAKSLAGAKNPAEVMELQGAYWRKQIDILMAQAEEVRTQEHQRGRAIKRDIEELARRVGSDS